MDEEARMPELDDDYRQRLDKQPLWHTYPILYEQVLAICVDADPIGICDGGERRTAYTPEVNTLLPRLKEAGVAEDLIRIVREEFIAWFGSTAVRHDGSEDIGRAIWDVIQQPDRQREIQTIPRDLPHLVLTRLANLLIDYPDMSPAEYEAIAQVLRTKAVGFEQWAIGLRRRAENSSANTDREV